jgi:uncharacterized protein (DUF1800 family)
MQADLSGNLHLLWRAGFGPAVEDIPLVNRLDRKALYHQLVKRSSGKPGFINVASGTLDGLVKGLQTEGKMQELSKEQRAQIRKESREALKNLNLRWLDEMVHSGAQLREKMAFFWHGHFACREINVYFQQQLLDVIRTHALSDFRTLLREVSKSAAMLAFLNNQQNRKKQPNENFAREVMELFTLGRGNYTEQDIKEAARAFTGWGFDLSGQFVFRKQFHDGGLKTIFGRSGYFDGDDVINMLLENEQTARYITTKLYRFLVNEQADEKIVSQLAGSFYKSGYDISKLLEQIFLSEWFYDKKNIGVKIKSPVELIVGVRRILPMEFQNEEAILLYQRLLGQILFYPPNVAGWPGGRNWIDSSSLMYRLRLPRILKDDENIGLKPKDDDDVMMGMSDQVRRQVASRNVMVNINWPMYTSLFGNINRDRLGISIAATLLQTGRIDLDLLNGHADQGDRESYIRTFTVQVMSLPEYQLM